MLMLTRYVRSAYTALITLHSQAELARLSEQVRVR